MINGLPESWGKTALMREFDSILGFQNIFDFVYVPKNEYAHGKNRKYAFVNFVQDPPIQKAETVMLLSSRFDVRPATVQGFKENLKHARHKFGLRWEDDEHTPFIMNWV